MNLYFNKESLDDGFWLKRTNPNRIARLVLKVSPQLIYNTMSGDSTSIVVEKQLEETLNAPFWMISRAYQNQTAQAFPFGQNQIKAELRTVSNRSRLNRDSLIYAIEDRDHDHPRHRKALEKYFWLPISEIRRLWRGEDIKKVLTEYISKPPAA